LNKNKTNLFIGQTGEQEAEKFLVDKQYQILDKNYRVLNKEIDIIALDKSTEEIVFVEVKKRATQNYGHPSSAVTTNKLSRIITAAQIYLDKNGFAHNFRFDIISILPDRIEQFKNVSLGF
jgi:putative endonuclease